MNTDRALIIFAKHPVPGRVKTRLTPFLSPEEAADLYFCMLSDTLNKANRLEGVTPVLFYQDDPGAKEYFSTIDKAMETLPQRGENLGQKMENAFSDMFDRGFGRVAIVGSDSPDLPEEFVQEAFDLLGTGDRELVVCPAEDNGYCLLAMKRVWKELFRDIPWSTGEVMPVTIERIAASGILAAMLPTWHDIDTVADLQNSRLLERDNSAPLTRGFMEKFIAGTTS